MRSYACFAIGLLIPSLFVLALKSCSPTVGPPLRFSRNHAVIACPLCDEPAYLTEKQSALDWYGCGRHSVAVGRDDGKIFSAKERDDPELRKRIALYGLKSFKGGVSVVEKDGKD